MRLANSPPPGRHRLLAVYVYYLVRSRPGLAFGSLLLAMMAVGGATVIATGSWGERALATAVLALSLRDFKYAATELRSARRAVTR